MLGVAGAIDAVRRAESISAANPSHTPGAIQRRRGFRPATAGLVLLGCALLALARPAGAQSILKNGGFAEGEGTSAPGWATAGWSQNVPSEFSVRRDSTGLGFAVVRNPKPNDASWVQQVTVQPNNWYRLAGHVRAVGVDESSPAGASLSQTDGFERGRVVKGADSGWQRVEMWFKTDPSQRTANIACRLGSYGSLAAGEAWCTGIELTPQGGPPLNADFVFGPVEESTTPVGLPASLLLIGLVGYGLWRYARLPAGVPLRERLTLDGILLALLVAKLVVAPLWQYRIDIGAYSAWAMKLAVEGPARFYAPGYFADYPPGYMYVLWWIGMVAKAFSLGTSSFVTLIKLPAILADLAVSRLIFARLRGAGKRLAWLGAMAFALNPALVLDSAVWGQTDSILALLVLLAFFAQGERRFELAWIFAAVAVLTKPQAMLMVPLLVLWPVGWWKSGRPLLALLATLATVFVIADPFRGDRPWRWLIDLYGGTTGYYSETAVNAMNLQALLFGMRRPDSTILLGRTAQVWGYVIGGLLGLAFFVAYVRRPTRWAHASMFASATLVAFFCLSRMHERYLYPFFPFAALLGVTGPLGWLYGALSAVFFANEFIVYLFQKDASAGPNWLWMTVSALGVLGMLGWLAAMWRSSTGRLGETSEPAFTGDDDAWVRESAEALATSTAVRETARRVGSATAAAREPAWGWQELLLLALLTLGAAAIRFHDLGTPAEIVFDEVYFVEQGRNYISGKDFMDPHPPIAKLGIAAGIEMLGDKPVGWRLVNAIVGTALVPLMYLLARGLFLSPIAAGIAGLLAAIDGLLIVDSRIAVIDIHYVTWAVAAYALLVRMVRAGQLQNLPRLVALGVLIGLSVGAKLYIPFFSFLLVLATIALCGRQAARAARVPVLPWIARPILVVGSVASLVYVLSFAPHFLWGWWHSPLDLFKYITIKVPEYQAAVKTMTHPYSSKWWTWPLMMRPVWYFWKDPGEIPGTVSGIWGAGNPTIWWASVPALLLAAWVAVRERQPALAFVVAGWLIHIAPWVWIPRTLFLYHYLPSLLFALLALAWMLDRLWRGEGTAIERGLVGGALLASVLPACLNAAPAWSPLVFLGALVGYEGMVFSKRADSRVGPVAVAIWCCAAIAVTAYLFPIWIGSPIAKAAWQARMWISGSGFMNWI